MPPNKKGGKGYKKRKHQDEGAIPAWNRDDGQSWARVIKTLGNCRFQVYCEDNKCRIGKLAGSVTKSQWAEEGSYVLVSLRGLSSGIAHSNEDVADILAVLPQGLAGKLKKEEGIRQNIFVNVDSKNLAEIQRKVDDGEDLTAEQDDLFEDGDSESEDEEEDQNLSPEDNEKRKKLKQAAKEEKNKERTQARAKGRSNKESSRAVEDDGPLDIDNI
jgi:initiation factor 1A